ncbi:L,D-transpeptidase [Aquamicrobium segne]|uniref:L,D-transpeptidase n=1 Tax=Aquamicrobium segne TaxID=469547 RepID=A0ABW0GXA6_9HYPH
MTDITCNAKRRSLQGAFSALALLACAGLTACSTTKTTPTPPGLSPVEPAAAAQNQSQALVTPPRHGPRPNERFPLPDQDISQIPEKFHRQMVNYQSEYPTGTIIVDPASRFLYLVQPNGKALRYGVAVGAAGRSFSGIADLAWKQEWPRWRPTDSMIARSPEQYKKFENGVEGGPQNPLGARALYLFQDGKDTYYRIHGTNQPGSIGKAVSAGCIRMLNIDVIDLYQRVRTGSKVVVL